MIDTTTGEVTSVSASSIGSLIRERVLQVNIERLVRQMSGRISTLSAWLGGRQDDRPVHAAVELLDLSDRVPVPGQIDDYHALLHWLHEQMPCSVMATQAARVAPEHPEILWKKYGAKFAQDLQGKRALYVCKHRARQLLRLDLMEVGCRLREM